MTTTNTAPTAAEIRAARLAHGMRQEDLAAHVAREAGLDQPLNLTTVWKWEQGARPARWAVPILRRLIASAPQDAPTRRRAPNKPRG